MSRRSYWSLTRITYVVLIKTCISSGRPLTAGPSQAYFRASKFGPEIFLIILLTSVTQLSLKRTHSCICGRGARAPASPSRRRVRRPKKWWAARREDAAPCVRTRRCPGHTQRGRGASWPSSPGATGEFLAGGGRRQAPARAWQAATNEKKFKGALASAILHSSRPPCG
jgi:hypothetical protein